MWQRVKRLFHQRTRSRVVSPDREVIQFDARGFTRSSELIRALGIQETWPWAQLMEFGFHVGPALFPDPWIGEYMEAQWFVQVQNAEGLERIFFELDALDIDRLPPHLLVNLPGLDMAALRHGLKTARGGWRACKQAGEWIGWRRSAMPVCT